MGVADGIYFLSHTQALRRAEIVGTFHNVNRRYDFAVVRWFSNSQFFLKDIEAVGA
jgi:hypothetical protein